MATKRPCCGSTTKAVHRPEVAKRCELMLALALTSTTVAKATLGLTVTMVTTEPRYGLVWTLVC